ncbi:hypothetical protein FRIG_07400 [Frigoribacterium faeni]|uniref:hypothetical protein n=1 Tax=Frigoribacterium faeni TaxID=145483 RepID=UPI001FADF70E|nr:hypothetical protein [Frigoribacterium faeni]MCJ0700957.1 hypothetical protein [Frigoribacterium faeni]
MTDALEQARAEAAAAVAAAEKAKQDAEAALARAERLAADAEAAPTTCLLYTSPSPRDGKKKKKQ